MRVCRYRALTYSVHADVAPVAFLAFGPDGFQQRRHLAAVCDEALREYEDGFRVYLELVSDPAFDGAPWEAVRAAVLPSNHGAAVLFIADSTTFAPPDHPVLVVDLLDDSLRPFRCIPPELWAVENNLNIANMDWESFVGEVDEDGVYRGLRA